MGCNYFRVVPEDNLHFFDNYTFTNSVYTPLDKLLDKFWFTPVSKLVPRWFPPCLLTLFGGLSIFTLNFLAFTRIPNLESKLCPRYLALLSGLLFLSYLTFDGIDGKHARAIDVSTPFGELLDHGLDAIVTAFFAYPFFVLSPGGYNKYLALASTTSLLNLFFVNWNQLKHGFYAYSSTSMLGVTEPIVSFALLLLLHYFKPGLLHTPVVNLLPSGWFFEKFHEWLPKDLLLVVLLQCFALSLASYSVLLFVVSLYKRSKCYFGSTVFVLYALLNTALPSWVVLNAPKDRTVLFCVFASSIGGIANVEWVITMVIKTKLRFVHLQLVPHYLLLLHFVLLYFEKSLGLNLTFLHVNPELYYKVLLLTTVFGLLFTVLKFFKTVWEIRDYLGMSLLDVHKKDPKKRN